MKSVESVREFYKLHGQTNARTQFNVYRREEFACDSTSLPPNRRDFYKISLLTKGEGIISYVDRSFKVKDSVIAFMNPLIPYSWQPLTQEQTGYFCLFSEEFIDPTFKAASLSLSTLFKAGGSQVFFPDEEGMTKLIGIFESMLSENESSYSNKYDLLRSYVQIVMHEALKMQVPDTYHETKNASQRISNMFIELLNKQFPLDSPDQLIQLKNANEFANKLSIHTNHLNRAVKESTGKTTTEWIAEKIVMEAKALLLHSGWQVAAIGYCLGFEHASNFNVFFKKQTGYTPTEFRKAIVSIS
jgi:AraC family transcriptional activator of pobA